MAELFLPVLSHFQNQNPWTGSLGRLRFRAVPTVTGGESDEPTGDITVELWEGPWAYEFSTVEETKTFPLTQEGLDALSGFVSQWAETVNARPKRSLAEDLSRRSEPTSQP